MITLADFIAQLTIHVAHERGWSLEDATRWVAHHMEEVRAEYREKGAPLGDTEEGFIAWLAPRPHPPTA